MPYLLVNSYGFLEAQFSFEMSVTVYQLIWCNMQEHFKPSSAQLRALCFTLIHETWYENSVTSGYISHVSLTFVLLVIAMS
jgi:hypothetical protein